MDCDACGAPMRLRIARLGSNPGRSFWGCSKYPACKHTRTHAPSSSGPPTADGTQRHGTRIARPQQRRVNWHDATLTRPGWRCYYATAGASLRQMLSPLWPTAAGCWLASTSHGPHAGGHEAADVSAAAVAAAMRKLLARGSAPPMHPAAETRLLELLTTDPSNELAVGDFTIPPGVCMSLEVSLVESPAEEALLRWAHRHRPEVSRWLVPQPPLDVLAAAAGQGRPADKRLTGRRCDFLLAAPGLSPLVVEVDGSQHEGQQRVDAQRDRLINAAGIDVIRVSASEAFAGSGPSLETLDSRLGATRTDAPAGSGASEVMWAAVQAHRLVLAMCEALATGMLTGRRWAVRLHDPTGLAARIVGPYLGLFDALDAMWGDRSVAPEEVAFTTEENVVCWRREPLGGYTETLSPTGDAPSGDHVEIRLEAAAGPAAVLPDPTGPMVVVRSSWLPMPVHDHIDTLPQRRAAFPAATADEASEAVAVLMRGLFAVEDPREGQSEAIVETLTGCDCVVLLPTGAGKSMIYQLAGLCMPGRTLVVDPLVSLIEDQVESLARHGIDRAAGITASDRRPDALDGAYFVFVSPERLQRQSFRDELTERSKTLPVNLAVIDEAHCVSEWGHDFRAAYLNFGRLLRSTCAGALGPPPLLALTGTASRAVLNDVMFQLEIVPTGDNTLIRPASFDRPELRFEVVRASPDSAAACLRSELHAMPARFGVPAASFYAPAGDATCSGIVFTTTVGGRERGLSTAIEDVRQFADGAVRYAGRAPEGVSAADWQHEKTESARAFKDNEAPVMVTTKAFGMGIDKPNVRWILHYGMPSSIEGYYQEAGRAGRDRRTAHCVLLLIDRDPDQNRRLLADGASASTAPQGRDDVGTALWFHSRAFPDPDKEHRRISKVYGHIATGDTYMPLRDDDSAAGDNERALHRLAVLGIVSDYTLNGAYDTLTATVKVTDPSPQQIVASLLAFVERTQPGRSASMRDRLAGAHESARGAVDVCGEALVDFVYDTIERSRRRSLREMWLIASSAAARGGDAGGETIRGRVLEYLTEGDATPVLLDLAEREQFAYSDWTPHWERIASETDAREWRAAAARLLVSYPDHPGLLASRALAEMLLADGDPTDAEDNLRRSYQQAADTYSTAHEDISDAAQWTLAQLEHSNRPPATPISGLASTMRPQGAPVATAAAAAMSIPALVSDVRDWLAPRWKHSDALAALYLTDQLRTAAELAAAALARY